MKKGEEHYLLKGLLAEPNGEQLENCISAEDISLILDGTADNNERQRIISHASGCKRCNDALAIAAGLSENRRNVLLRFPVRSIAATLLVFFFSVYLFFKINNVDKGTIKNILNERQSAPGLIAEKKAVTEEQPKMGFEADKEMKKKVAGKAKLKSKGKSEPLPAFQDELRSVRKTDHLVKKDNPAEKKEEKKAEKREGEAAVKFRIAGAKPYISVIEKPSPVYTPDIEIPQVSGKSLQKSSVNAVFILNSDGTVKSVTITGDIEGMEDLIIESLEKWKFNVDQPFPGSFKLELKFDSRGKWILKKISRKIHFPAD